MTQEDIIRMAREAGFYGQYPEAYNIVMIERFAELVAAAEREACLDAMMQSVSKGIDTAIAIEREACAKECEEIERKATNQPPMVGQGCQACAYAIRARGQA